MSKTKPGFCDHVPRRLQPKEKISFKFYNNLVRTSQETHYVSAKKPNRLMLFRETVAVYCENHTNHTCTLCGQNAGCVYITTGL
jgi:hypothetical protein